MEYFGGAYIPGGKIPVYGEKKQEEKKEESHWFKNVIFWLFLFFFTVGFCLTLAEVVLRIIPGQWSNTFFHVYDPVLGTWHIPSHTGDYAQPDFTTKGITINSYGMRDREHELTKATGTLRVAVLGDSFVEAFHVNDDQTFTRVMEARSSGKLEVLNFGVAGFGTAQEYLTYIERVRQWKPDIVILAFLSANDMRNNSRTLEDLYTGAPNTDRPFPERDGTSSWKIVPPTPKPYANNPLLLFVKKHFTLYRFLWYEKNALQAKYGSVSVSATPDSALPQEGSAYAASTTPDASSSPTVATSTGTSTKSEEKKQNVSVYLANLFAPPKEEPFIGAWDATEWSIVKLKDAVEADGAKFVLATLPDATKMESDPRARLEEEYKATLPSAFDIDYPEKRLAQFSKIQKITFLDLTPGFRLRRDQINLRPPYFSYPHDGHWNPTGHDLAAELINNFLQKSKLIP